MSNVSIIFHTGLGHTGKAAHAVAEGARQVSGAVVQVFEITGDQIGADGRWKDDAVMQSLTDSDAIIFGSPTYMGGVSGPFMCFADATSEPWFAQKWKNKICGSFSSSGNPSGDKTMTHHYLITLAMQHGMIYVGNGEYPSPLTGDDQNINTAGHYAGVGVVGGIQPDDGTPNEGDLETCRRYGKRIAEISVAVSSQLRKIAPPRDEVQGGD